MAKNQSLAQVGILGYGVIGRRLATAIARQPDMMLIGVAGRQGSVSLSRARSHGYHTYRIDRSDTASGDATFRDFVSQLDVLLDCTPSGVPLESRQWLEPFPELVTIVQGGETSSTCDFSFNSMANFSASRCAKRIRVISCSSTGTTRFLFALHTTIGVQDAFVTLARRSADPGKLGKVPLNALAPTMGPSHHARDVHSVLPEVRLSTVSVDCPTTLGHVLWFHIQLAQPADRQSVLAALESVPRIMVGNSLRSTSDLASHFSKLGRYRYDRAELYVFHDTVMVHETTLVAAASVHMESITIPETVDCIRSALRMESDPWRSIWLTDQSLEIAQSQSRYHSPVVPFISV